MTGGQHRRPHAESVPFRQNMADPSAVIRRVLVGASLGWAVAIPSATWMATLAQPSIPAFLFALFVYAVGGVVCHQLPDRSFLLWGRQLPVCARCTGIYAGAAAAALVALAGRRFARGTFARGTRLRILMCAALPNAATLAYEWMSGAAPGNAIRAAAGFALGAVVASLLVYDVD